MAPGAGTGGITALGLVVLGHIVPMVAILGLPRDAAAGRRQSSLTVHMGRRPIGTAILSNPSTYLMYIFTESTHWEP